MKQGHLAILKLAMVEVCVPQKSENAINLTWCIVLLFSTLQKMGGGKSEPSRLKIKVCHLYHYILNSAKSTIFYRIQKLLTNLAKMSLI